MSGVTFQFSHQITPVFRFLDFRQPLYLDPCSQIPGSGLAGEEISSVPPSSGILWRSESADSSLSGRCKAVTVAS